MDWKLPTENTFPGRKIENRIVKKIKITINIERVELLLYKERNREIILLFDINFSTSQNTFTGTIST
jgi:hypothetical protein